MKKILIALLTVLCLQTLVLATDLPDDDKYLTQRPYDTNYAKMRRCAVGVNYLNSKLIYGYAYSGKMLTNPFEIFNMISHNEEVDSSKTTKNSFTTKKGITYTMISLKDTCEAAPAESFIEPQTACAKIIISYKNADDKFQVYMYKDQFKHAKNSQEEKLFDSKTWF